MFDCVILLSFQANGINIYMSFSVVVTVVRVLLYRVAIRTLSLWVKWFDTKNKAQQRSQQLLRSRQIRSVTQNNIRLGHRWKGAVFVTYEARVMKSFARSWMRWHRWEILLCFNMTKKLTERHKVTDNPWGNCYLLMTAAAVLCTHKHNTQTHCAGVREYEYDTLCVMLEG